MDNGQISSEGIEVFISYSHKDELLRDELEKHLSILKRQKLIFTWFDRIIGAGVEWKEQIDEHLDSAQIILLLISADFLASDYCYDIEMNRAIERHESGEARVIPIILRPVDWKGAPFGKLQALPKNAEPVVSRKWGSIDEAFVDVAKGLRDTIESFNLKIDSARANSRMAPIAGLKNIIVDQMHRGDYSTINTAIASAAPGSRILIRPGVYDEELIIDKPLEIVGDGMIGEVVIRASGKHTVSFETTKGKISNLMIRQNGGGDYYGVDISQGYLELDGCDITSDSLFCVAIHENAYPKIFGNRIHNGKGCGILVYDNGQGVIEDNEIYGNAHSGVGIRIREGSNPTLRRNKIHDEGIGILIYDNGKGVIEDNEIYGNDFGICIRKGNNPTIRRNKIHDTIDAGIAVYENNQGVIEDNEIYDSLSGVAIMEGSSNLTLNHNKIYNIKAVGIAVYENCQGLIEDNEIYDNDLGVRIVGGSSDLTIRRNRIHDGKSIGIFVYEDGQGIIEDNEIYGYSHSGVGIRIREGSNPTLKHNKIHDDEIGILVYENGQGVIEDNEIYGNRFGVVIMKGSNPTFRRNNIYESKAAGIWVLEEGQGVIEDNDVYGNKFGIGITKGNSSLTIKHNKIHDSTYAGICVFENGQGVIEDNEIYGNDHSGVEINEGSNPTLKRNKIHDSKDSGIFVNENGQGVIEDNKIYENNWGVSISTGGNPTIKHNCINKNSYEAIRIFGSGAGIIEDNDLRENKCGPWKISKDSKSLVKRVRNQEK